MVFDFGRGLPDVVPSAADLRDLGLVIARGSGHALPALSPSVFGPAAGCGSRSAARAHHLGGRPAPIRYRASPSGEARDLLRTVAFGRRGRASQSSRPVEHRATRRRESGGDAQRLDPEPHERCRTKQADKARERANRQGRTNGEGGTKRGWNPALVDLLRCMC
jgi:hypothetical protein